MFCARLNQELMNCYARRSESHFLNEPYMDFNLLVLTSFEVTTVTTMILKSPPAVTIATSLAS